MSHLSRRPTTPTPTAPPAEVSVTETLVAQLLADQHPDLAGLSLRAVAEGWDNVIFRLGDDLCVRLPRRAMAAPLLLKELDVVPALARRLAAAGVGIDGGLDGLDVPVRERLARVSGRPDADALGRLWERLRATAPRTGPRRWVHGDLHPGNLLFGPDGRLAAVIDFGDVCAGDPAVDLACSWQLFGPADRATFRSLLDDDGPGYDAECWLRAAGWALHFGLLSVATEGNDPAFVRNGEATLAALLEDFSPTDR